MEDSLAFGINLLLRIFLLASCQKGYVHYDVKGVTAACLDMAVGFG